MRADRVVYDIHFMLAAACSECSPPAMSSSEEVVFGWVGVFLG